FSFGDYFKHDAIQWAWEFLTDKKWLGIDPDRLTVTVYKDDDEAATIWHETVGLPHARIARMDEDENFWPASAPSEGPDGVCGPCSEIYFKTDGGGEVEIWNLVFTQFNRVGDPPNNLEPLPSKNIDTGMGLERTAAVLQGVETNYHIDSLLPIVKAAAEVCAVEYVPDSENGRRLRRITDHVRACTFAIHENVYPGANKEKYVIRRLLRRAVLDGHQMGRRDPFLGEIVPAVVEVMKSTYPELTETTDRVAKVMRQEEEAFLARLDNGLQKIERIFSAMDAEGQKLVSGAEAADLYTTDGFPAEMFETIAEERGFGFDWDGYREAMERHGIISGTIGSGVMGDDGSPIEVIKRTFKECEFLGYDTTECTAEVKGLIAGDNNVDSIDSVGEQVLVVLDRTSFYGESGGQVGDAGTITSDTANLCVNDVQKDGGLFVHSCTLNSGTLNVGDSVTATVDSSRRDAIRRAHSATHILHYALQKHVGSHAQQQGSKVDDDWLRFDFTNLEPVSPEQLDAIELDVRERVASAAAVKAEIIPLAEARAAGAMMLFGEKYPDPVRMVSMGDFSKELCGGTHLSSTDEVQGFEIVSEEGVAAGIRRVVALTGQKAKEHMANVQSSLQQAAKLLGCPLSETPAAVAKLLDQIRELKKQVSAGSVKNADTSLPTWSTGTDDLTESRMKTALRDTARALNVGFQDVSQRVASLVAELQKLAKQADELSQQKGTSAAELIESAETIGDVKVIVAQLEVPNSNVMRQLIDQVRKQASPAAVFLIAADGDSKVVMVAGVSNELVERGVRAGDWVKEIAPIVGGGGGGKPDMAQAGGKKPAEVPTAIERAKGFIRTALA
ncbi:MAG: alanine--tRNA ligase, partial [Planctomycetales bacterium]|nr:alanine--tRNA ligase [Planctomycetales bacterium]